MGCMWAKSISPTKAIFETVPKETVSDLLAASYKCKVCQKGFGHSFAPVSKCIQCEAKVHTRCIPNECPICH